MTKFSPASRPLQSPQLRHHGTQQPIALKIVHLLFQQRLCQRQKRNHQMNLLLMKRLSLSGPACMLSRVRLRAIAWTVDRQAPLSMGSSRQEYWSGLPFPPPGDLADPGIQPAFLESSCIGRQTLFFFFNHCATWEASATECFLQIPKRV